MNLTFLISFFSQIEAISQINKWSDQEKLIFLKSKLTGAALRFVIDSPNFDNFNYEDLKKSLRDFFTNKSQTSSLIEFNNLNLLPQESIKNFAHRLDSLTAKVYNIKDSDSLNNIKFIKLIGSLPSNIRVKILEEDIKLYPELVNRAQQLQDIFCSEALLINNENGSINSKLNALAEKINSLTFNPNKEGIHENKSENDKKTQQKSRINPDRSSPENKTRYKAKQPIKCQICNRLFHSAKFCYKYTNLKNKSNQNNRKPPFNSRYSNRYQNNDSNNSYYPLN